MAQILVATVIAATSFTVPAMERPVGTGHEWEPAQPTAERWDGTVEYWRPLLERYWAADDVPWALAIIDCESGGDPYAKNPYSSASGLFQQLGSFWPERATAAGWEGSSVFDPEANIAVSAWLYSWGGPSHWECKA